MQEPPARQPLWQRFPAAHQFLRARLMDTLFPNVPAVSAWVQAEAADGWLVLLRAPELAFARSERFSGDELRQVFGRWAQWCRARADELADRPGP